MDVREKLVELLDDIQVRGEDFTDYEIYGMRVPDTVSNEDVASHLIANGVTVQERARTLGEWGEDYGDVLWWKFPIEEPPYVGSPLDMAWPGYHTHWTLIPMPQPPKGE